MKPLATSSIEKVVHICSLTVNSRDEANITFHLANIPEEKAKRIFRIAKGAFREIDIVSETTGEILISEYTSNEWFNSACSYGEAIDDIIAIYEGK